MNKYITGLCIIQFGIILLFIFKQRHDTSINYESTTYSSKSSIQKVPSQSINLHIMHTNSFVSTNTTMKHFDGVAVSLFFHTPTWFLRRYTIMIQNIKNNIPSTWKIQIFYTGEGQSQNAININKGIQRMVDNGDIILTKIPSSIVKRKRKQYEIWTDLWIWEHIIGDKVLLFGGNSVMCSNSLYTINDFLQYDYIGSPWYNYQGLGGVSGISLRTRQVMIDIIKYETSKDKYKINPKIAYKSFGHDDVFFVSRLIEMNTILKTSYTIATRNDTLKFGATNHFVSYGVLSATGILGEMNDKDREQFLGFCPELKVIFPSLHNPNCFGATPNSEKCAMSICALRNTTERRGGC